ncbi:MAG TPA: protein kinase family protein [Nocardioides sp.]|nr:protein kinase family protein [Nocardioides sp.]
MPNSVRPGDVLADRYRLVDLLTESGNGRFWRAHDKVLARHVALHVIEADDERAAGLLDAARRSATVLDRHLLRVLDADQTEGLCFVVNEWGSGSSLDILLANEGPMGARRAAWLVSEVAACVAVAHEAGVAHGRLAPENVLVDRTGSVRVIGFCVDAALHGLPPGRISTDVADLGGLLYSALTGKWPGVSRSDVPPAPGEHGRILRPRQVRAGIPRPLDELCDQVVNPYAAHAPHTRESHDLTTAGGIHDYLSEFVGDATGMAEAEAAIHPAGPPASWSAPPQRENATVVLPSATPSPTVAHQVDPPTEALVESPVDPAPDEAEVEAPAAASEPETPASPVEQPTQAGLPIFDDDNDDVSWLTAGTATPPPPPPFEEPPERPLFAPEPRDGGPARRSRPAPHGSAGPPEYWPWDTSSTGTGVTPVSDDAEDDGVPGRSWLRLAAIVGAAVLLLVAVVVAYNLGRGKTPLGAEPDERAPSSATPTGSSSTTPITGLVANDFDPQGDPPEENAELAPLAVDGDASTSWRSMTYDQDMGPGGLKTGVGLTIDLGESQDVSEVDLALVGAPTGVSVYVTDEAPTGVRGLTAAASVTAKLRQRITLDEPVTGRYVTVWLTSLPQIEGGYRGEIAEVAVRG